MSSPTNRQLIEDRACNRLKSDQLPADLLPRTFVTDRTW